MTKSGTETAAPSRPILQGEVEAGRTPGRSSVRRKPTPSGGDRRAVETGRTYRTARTAVSPTGSLAIHASWRGNAVSRAAALAPSRESLSPFRKTVASPGDAIRSETSLPRTSGASCRCLRNHPTPLQPPGGRSPAIAGRTGSQAASSRPGSAQAGSSPARKRHANRSSIPSGPSKDAAERETGLGSCAATGQAQRNVRASARHAPVRPPVRRDRRHGAEPPATTRGRLPRRAGEGRRDRLCRWWP